MRRADRLFEIIQVLRRSSKPLTAGAIAAELETSKRTIYRDIGALIAQRVPISGEAGIGYVLHRGFELPPLMLTTDETEAVALGCQWVVAHADDALARAALDVLAKVAVVMPKEVRSVLESPAVGTLPCEQRDAGDVDVGRLREWSRTGCKLAIEYEDEAGIGTARVFRPFMVGYVARLRTVIAWCELRDDFRVFRIDRLRKVEFLAERYAEDPVLLRRRWLATLRERRQRPPEPGRGE